MDFEISAGQVKAMMKQGEKFTLLDVREPGEWQKASLEGSKNISMGDIPARAHQELDPEELGEPPRDYALPVDLLRHADGACQALLGDRRSRRP